MVERGWQVEDGFFGALLGAGLGVIAPSSSALCFILLVVLLAAIVLLINKAGVSAGLRRFSLIASALVFIALMCIALYLIGFFEWRYGLWLSGPICAWVLVKLESDIGATRRK